MKKKCTLKQTYQFFIILVPLIAEKLETFRQTVKLRRTAERRLRIGRMLGDDQGPFLRPKWNRYVEIKITKPFSVYLTDRVAYFHSHTLTQDRQTD